MTDATLVPQSPVVFRNPKQMIYYLKKRPGQAASEANYPVGPGMTVEALDDAEAQLLASVGLIDVRKETPAIAQNLTALQDQLREAREQNVKLKAEKEALEQKSAETKELAKPEPEVASPVKHSRRR